MPLLLEKLPFFAIALGTCVLTFLAQRSGGAVSGLDALPLSSRLFNVVNSYVVYMWRMVWPWPLSFFYPLNLHLPVWRIAGCALVLIVATTFCFILQRTKPYLLFGWFWFLGTLVPVIGIVQVGSQGLADRYTYIPSIGLLVACVWLMSWLLKRLHLDTLLPSVAAGGIIFTYMLVSFEYLNHWENEIELYKYALAINEKNVVAHNNYGNILNSIGKSDESMEHYKKILNYAPTSGIALVNLAKLQAAKGCFETAKSNLFKAIHFNPKFPSSYSVLAGLYYDEGDINTTEKLLRLAYTIDNKDTSILINLTNTLIEQAKIDEALFLYHEGLAKAYDKDPGKAALLNNFGYYFFNKLEYNKAISAFTKALALQPKFVTASRNLARVMLARHETANAETQLHKTLAFAPNDSQSMCLLANIYLDRKQFSRAYVWFRRALAVNPISADAHEGLAVLLRAYGQPDAADIHAARVSDLRILLRPSRLATMAKARDCTDGKPPTMRH